MIQKNDLFVTEEEIASTAEILACDGSLAVKRCQAFSIYNMLALINITCISKEDRVLILWEAGDDIFWAVAYMCLPLSLEVHVANKQVGSISENNNELEQRWEDVAGLLREFACTKPSIVDCASGERTHSEAYDVIIDCRCRRNLLDSSPDSNNRFIMETGEEYKAYEDMLISKGSFLSNGGRIILLCRPCWILRSWQLLHSLKLQVDYQDYAFFINSEFSPNSLMWMRLSKNQENFNVEKQKNNIEALMEDTNIDRLYAHRNNEIFPYAELSYTNAEGYMEIEQNYEYMQYFFSLKTTRKLADLCSGPTACLVTPSVARYGYEENKDVVLFERDNRFREKNGLKFVKYDLNKGLTKYTLKYANRFNTIICDPPFDVRLDVLARDILQLIRLKTHSVAYVVFPEHRRISLINAMNSSGFQIVNFEEIEMEYSKPPKLVRLYGKGAIRLYKFMLKGT